MNSRLALVSDWPTLPRAARYNYEELAILCGVSLRQLERFFLDHFKQTPKQWLQSLRMKLALGLIGQGYSTRAVAEELHYEGASQFCREFKKFYRYPPQHFAPGCASHKSPLAHEVPFGILPAALESRLQEEQSETRNNAADLSSHEHRKQDAQAAKSYFNPAQSASATSAGVGCASKTSPSLNLGGKGQSLSTQPCQ